MPRRRALEGQREEAVQELSPKSRAAKEF